MENRKEGTINLIALILVIAFAVLSCFVCFEFYFTSRIEVDGISAGTPSLTAEKTNNIPVVTVLSVLQVLFICLKKRVFSLISMGCSILGVLVTALEVLKCFAQSAIGSMGGLGTTDFKITVIGYFVILLSVVNLIVQAISIKKKRSEINAFNNNSSGD